MELEFFASCLAGMEKLLAAELKTFGIDRVRPLGGGVAFFCEPESALRACLWSRLASRVMLVVGRVNAGDANLLYAGVYDIPWEDVLAEDATMAVRAHGTNDQLRNTRFTALKVKDAIADRLRSKRNARPNVDTHAPRTSIDVRVRDRRATVSIDFSGEALNHRTYLSPDDREDAALACSLAAGALAFGGWGDSSDRPDGRGDLAVAIGSVDSAGGLAQRGAAADAGGLAQRGAAFVDPACRDGILVVEAASIACDLAPGLHRTKWGFEGWAQFDSAKWRQLLDEATQRFEAGLVRVGGEGALDMARSARPDLDRVRFVGASTSSPFISKARDHVRRAGLRPVVSIELSDAAGMKEFFAEHRALSHARLSLVASNIDARSRSDSPAHVQADEAAFATACSLAPAGSRFVAVGACDVAPRFGVEPSERLRVGRGRIETHFELFDERPCGGTVIEIPDSAGGAPHNVEVLESASEQFAARLRKMFKERRKWAAREGVSCYRVYDSDLPDYAVAIDVYTGAGDARGNTYLHIAEYAPPASVDASKARRRFSDVLAIAPVVCDIRPDHVFSKTRIREKGGGQYRNAGHRAYVTTVEEGGYRFEVDLAGRLDTGLFLDHRLTRRLIQDKAAEIAAERERLGRELRFLNLFAYTGTASVYAAGGGAARTTTVDLSQTYLDWAQRNMAANGFSGEGHAFEKTDVIRWITAARRSGQRFDLVFVDPPTFSNSKAMGKRTWDVQRDHVELLIGVSRLLSEDGLAVFSCNLRSFKPHYEELEKYGVELEDVSLSTIPEDFSRTPKIHKCYLLRRV